MSLYVSCVLHAAIMRLCFLCHFCTYCISVHGHG